MTANQITVPHEMDAAPMHFDRREQDFARVEAFAQAKRHSARVRFLKLVLPAVASAIVVTFIGYSFWSLPGGSTIDIGEIGFSDGKLVMANPKLEGFTNSRPYSMTAARALQDPAVAELIELEDITAKLPVDAETWATVGASSGLFDRKKNTLSISEPITVTTTDGTTALLQSAFFNVKAGTLTTDQPIDISMEGMQISADSMRVLKGGEVLVFSRKVRMNIEPGRMKTAEVEGGALNAQN